MPKPALGRGLGHLLGDTRIADSPQELPLEAAEPANPPAVGMGLGNLLSAGKNGDAALAEPPPADEIQAVPATESTPARHYTPVSIYKPKNPFPPPAPAAAAPEPEPAMEEWHAPRWILLAADGLLMALASLLVFKSPAPLRAWEMVICVSAVALGALLACLAVLMPPGRK